MGEKKHQKRGAKSQKPMGQRRNHKGTLKYLEENKNKTYQNL